MLTHIKNFIKNVFSKILNYFRNVLEIEDNDIQNKVVDTKTNQEIINYDNSNKFLYLGLGIIPLSFGIYY